MITALAQLTIVAMLAQNAAPPAPPATPPVMRPAPPAPPLQPAPPADPPPPAAPAPPETGTPAPAPQPAAAAPPVSPPAGTDTPQPTPQQQPPPGNPFPPGPPPPAPPPPEEPRERRYGDEGRSELSLGLGYTQQTGFVGNGGYRHFVIDGVAPGAEGTVQSHDGQTTGLLLGSLRVVPVRTTAAALVLTARAGRVLLSGHDDGWGAGGSAGVIFFVGPNLGLEVSYGILWLLPHAFCADLTSCTIQGPELGLRVGF